MGQIMKTTNGQAADTMSRPPFAEYRSAGLSCIPVKGDGSKAPAVSSWKQYTKRLPSEALVKRWTEKAAGIGIIGGAVSGNLEILDIDEPELTAPFTEAIGLQAPELYPKLTRIRTPRRNWRGKSGGHLIYRCETSVDGNLKLAMSAPEPEVDADGGPVVNPKTGRQNKKPRVQLETRGEGGYALAVGCAPSCHPTGNLYEHVGGPPLTELTVITEAERKILHDTARSFDHSAGNAHVDEPVPGYEKSKPGDSPGDAFNHQTTWPEILEPFGWTRHATYGDITQWCRPGKTGACSATTGIRSTAGNELLTVFSTNACPFEGAKPDGRPGVTYNKFSAYALLNHEGDFSAAAKDLLAKGFGTPSAYGKQRRAKSQPPPPPSNGKKLPTITVSVDEDRVIDETIRAVAKDKELFQRCGRLVQVVRDAAPPRGISRQQNAPRIGPITFARLQELEAKNARFAVPVSKTEVELKHPPQWLTNSVLARCQWKGIRRLEAIVESPTLRADGTILQASGYDESTGLIFEPRTKFPEIPAEPAEQAVQQAREDLLEVVQDFPFKSDAHRAAWLSGLLTPLARYAFAGPSPLTLIDANIRGSGKSLLADVTAIIAAGRPMSRMTQPRDEEETRKRITSLALAGEPLILIDNIAGAFGDASIDAALTGTTWSDRVLGKSEMATGIPLYACWYATGNNVVLKGDTSRRVVHCRLESVEENPEERSGFVHADLASWVAQERPRLTAAALTILAGYCAAGYPDMDLKPWGSFEGWSSLVRSAVAWCGLPDPGENRRELAEQADTEIAALALLIEGWATVDPAGDGMTVASVVDAINDYQKNHFATIPTEFQQLRDAISELVPASGGRFPSARAVGRKLTHLRQRVIGNRYLDSKTSRIGNLWYVKTV